MDASGKVDHATECIGRPFHRQIYDRIKSVPIHHQSLAR